jgi:long-chain acyl-CoA synthetase
MKLAHDGELLIRGAVIMSGYRTQPEKTREAIDSEGWLHTGDVGDFDDDGYLKIVDRKKALIINAGGKNMSPAHIEAKVNASSPLIGQVIAIGDGKPFNVGLITLDPDMAPACAQQHGRRQCWRRSSAASTRPTKPWRGSSRSRSSRSSTPSGSRAATS